MSSQTTAPVSPIGIIRQLVDENKILIEAFLASERECGIILTHDLAFKDVQARIGTSLRKLIQEIRSSMDRLSALNQTLGGG